MKFCKAAELYPGVKKGKCIRGKDTEQRNGYGLQEVNAISQNCEKAFPEIKKEVSKEYFNNSARIS